MTDSKTLKTLLLPTLALALLATGCPPERSWTDGVRGNAKFDCADSYACNLATQAIAAEGATVELMFDTDDAVAQVTSSDPSVLTFEHTGFAHTKATSHAAGTADLILLDAAGKEVDRLPLRVERVAQLQFEGGAPKGAIGLMAGTELVMMMRKLGKGGDGDLLLGEGGIRIGTNGTLSLVENKESAAGLGLFSGGHDVVIVGGKPGGGTLALETGDVKLQIPVVLVEEKDIAKIDGQALPGKLGDGGFSIPFRYRAVTSDGTGVFGAYCNWSMSDVSVQGSFSKPSTSKEVQEYLLQWTPDHLDHFFLTQPGSFEATCTVGNARLVVPLVRP